MSAGDDNEQSVIAAVDSWTCRRAACLACAPFLLLLLRADVSMWRSCGESGLAIPTGINRPPPYHADGQCQPAGALAPASRPCARSKIMDPEQAQESSERDQLWASLRALRPEIDRLAAERFDSSDRQRQIISLLARIVAAEMDYRAKEASPE
jgi:hypothetical protein